MAKTPTDTSDSVAVRKDRATISGRRARPRCSCDSFGSGVCPDCRALVARRLGATMRNRGSSEPADLAINERDGRVISADCRVPLIVGDDVLVIAQAFVEWFVRVRSSETSGELRHVVPVINAIRFGGAPNRFERELIEPGFRHLQRAMRAVKAD